MKNRAVKLIKNYLIIAGAGLLYALLFSQFNIAIPCVFNKITGFLCPACGATRMCVSVLRGDFMSAFYYNRLLFVLLPVFAFYAVIKSIQYIKKGEISYNKIDRFIFTAIIALLILFGILRNLH